NMGNLEALRERLEAARLETERMQQRTDAQHAPSMPQAPMSRKTPLHSVAPARTVWPYGTQVIEFPTDTRHSGPRASGLRPFRCQQGFTPCYIQLHQVRAISRTSDAGRVRSIAHKSPLLQSRALHSRCTALHGGWGRRRMVDRSRLFFARCPRRALPRAETQGAAEGTRPP